MNNKFLLVTDNDGRAAWNFAAKKTSLDTLEKLWSWAEKKLTREEINNEILLDTASEGRTIWHVVTKRAILSVFRNYGVGQKIQKGRKLINFYYAQSKGQDRLACDRLKWLIRGFTVGFGMV